MDLDELRLKMLREENTKLMRHEMKDFRKEEIAALEQRNAELRAKHEETKPDMLAALEGMANNHGFTVDRSRR